MRIVFMGTPEFAVPSLKMLVEAGYEIAAVVTQPDKPQGRGKKLTPPAVKEYAETQGIKVLQPVKIKTEEFANTLKEMKPDLFITVAYGKIIPDYVLDIPPMGCINVHGSLLPKYRGAAPIHWAIINGEKVTGITTMFTDVGMDTGDMLLKQEIEITQNMTAGELHDKLCMIGAEVLKKTLEQLEAGTLRRIPQRDEDASYASIMNKETGKIDWTKSALDIHNLVRGTNPWPGAYTLYKGEKMRVWKTSYPDANSSGGQPGTIIRAGKDGLLVSAGKGAVLIEEVQFDSGKRIQANENLYVNGQKISTGEVIG